MQFSMYPPFVGDSRRNYNLLDSDCSLARKFVSTISTYIGFSASSPRVLTRLIPEDHDGVKRQSRKNTISTYLALADHVCVLVLNNTPLYRYEVVIEHMLTNYTRVR